MYIGMYIKISFFEKKICFKKSKLYVSMKRIYHLQSRTASSRVWFMFHEAHTLLLLSDTSDQLKSVLKIQ